MVGFYLKRAFLAGVGVAVVLPGLDKVVFFPGKLPANNLLLEGILCFKMSTCIYYILEAIIARNCCLKDPVGKHVCRYQ